mgnify:CR=1 FL=1
MGKTTYRKPFFTLYWSSQQSEAKTSKKEKSSHM